MDRDKDTKIAIISSRLSAIEHILMKRFPEEEQEFIQVFGEEMNSFMKLITEKYGEQ